MIVEGKRRGRPADRTRPLAAGRTAEEALSESCKKGATVERHGSGTAVSGSTDEPSAAPCLVCLALRCSGTAGSA